MTLLALLRGDALDEGDLLALAIVSHEESFHIALLQSNKIRRLTLQTAVAAANGLWHVERLRKEEALWRTYARFKVKFSSAIFV